ncbi:hypothetical protein [Actinomadura litoris]|uniref:hypothetical protein n=1 Tax=Actinomadura litoris TaxID=2678616 RepID=UPI001FA7FFB5|nr:hypothetical protein [Actinomadura litoris]
MRSFSRHGSEMVTPSAVDPCMDDDGARRLRESMRRHDWRAVRGFFAGVEDPDDRSFYIGVCAGAPGVQDWITEWCRTQPKATLPLTIRAAHALTRDAAALAEECLAEVVARDEKDAPARALLVAAANAGDLDEAEARERFDEAVRVHPGHLHAHTRMLAYLQARDAHDDALAFAHEAVATAPKGSPLGVLVAEAHIGRWRSLPTARRGAYMSGDAVRADLVAAAGDSIRSSAYEARPGWPAIHNAFAFAFVMAGEVRWAAKQFEVIGDRVTEHPWDAYRDDPVEAFAELREWARTWIDT